MIKNILWDFDGVIIDSMKVRDWGFEEIFKMFSKKDVIKLLEFHRENGGLSRYMKIRHFHEVILNQGISEEEVLDFSLRFSDIMRDELVNPKYLIDDSLSFIKNNYRNYNFHIVSGSDQNELRFLIRELGIKKYFMTIHGSPTPKNKLVKSLLSRHKYKLKETCLIGDSINDYEAAKYNKISFKGYNNFNLKPLQTVYIDSFINFKIE